MLINCKRVHLLFYFSVITAGFLVYSFLYFEQSFNFYTNFRNKDEFCATDVML